MKKGESSEGLSGFIRKHKRLTVILSVAIGAILTAAIVLIVLLSSTKKDDYPKYNPVTNGRDSVSYYYNVAGGDMVLVFKSGWRFTIDGPQYSKSGGYSVQDGKIILDFLLDKDGEATATLGENKLTYTKDGVSYTYKEMISFTVSFETSGAEKVSSLEVINGKTAEEPESPSRMGYHFAGWYTDASCTEAFDFSTPITKDTTVYAKWVA